MVATVVGPMGSPHIGSDDGSLGRDCDWRSEVDIPAALARDARTPGSKWAHLRYCAPLCVLQLCVPSSGKDGRAAAANVRGPVTAILQELGPPMTLQDVLNKCVCEGGGAVAEWLGVEWEVIVWLVSWRWWR